MTSLSQGVNGLLPLRYMEISFIKKACLTAIDMPHGLVVYALGFTAVFKPATSRREIALVRLARSGPDTVPFL
jgi:hypothetical protein